MPISIIDDANPEWKVGGATIAWASVTAAAATAAIATPAAPTLATATTGGSIPPGTYYVATTWSSVYGETVLGAEATITVPPGTLTNTITITTAALPTNAVASNAYLGTVSGNDLYVQSITSGTSNVLVSLPKTEARGPLAVGTSGSTDGTIVFPDGLTVVAGQKGLRFGQFMTRITSGVSTGMYGPYDSSVSDGRQTITPGECGFLEKSILQNSPAGLTLSNVDNTGLIVGGKVYKGRLIATAGTHSLAAGPTYAEVLTALPRLSFVVNA